MTVLPKLLAKGDGSKAGDGRAVGVLGAGPPTAVAVVVDEAGGVLVTGDEAKGLSGGGNCQTRTTVRNAASKAMNRTERRPSVCGATRSQLWRSASTTRDRDRGGAWL